MKSSFIPSNYFMLIKIISFETLILAHLFFTFTSSAEDNNWTGWLGEEKTGQVSNFQIPQKWPTNLSLQWSVHVGSGYASPLAVKDRIFIHTRMGEHELAACLNIETGKTIWSKKYRAPFKMGGGGEKHGKGPKAHPVFKDEVFYTIGISGILSAWNAENGELIWRKVPGKAYGQPHAYWGVSNSPLVLDNQLINLFGNDEKGALISLDRNTGKTNWIIPCGGTCYSSPTYGILNGLKQVVVLHHESLIGVDYKSGEKLWEFSFPHKTHNQNTTTPIVFEEKVFFGGENRGIHCIQPKFKNKKWTVNKLWSQKQVALNMASPLIANQYLFGLSHYGLGRLFCINPKNGEILWLGNPRTAQNSTFLSFDQHILNLTNHGQIQILRASKDRLHEIANYKIAGQTWTPPVLTSNGLLIKNTENLSYHTF